MADNNLFSNNKTTETLVETQPDAVDASPTPVTGSRDRELELYRSLLDTPKEFHNGFTWTAVAGALFCGLLMMPGTIFLSLMTGGSINASWVTLIIFSEISRRALKTLNTQELVVLLYVSGAMTLGGPIAPLIFRQYLASSDAARDAGMAGLFPSWFVPDASSPAIIGRNLFHSDWTIIILIVLVTYVVGRVSGYTLGYFFFRLTSDVEKLPFPFAPVNAQGSMALAESGEKKTTWKWRVFSMGAMIGLIFGIIQIGVPLVTGAFLSKPIYLIPMPWYDTTTLTEGFLPATPTGLMIDVGLVLVGMVVPFWALVGTGIAIILTFFMNPILQHMGILSRWQPGMDTINTSYVNGIDFWISFTIGITAGIALISIYQTTRDVIKAVKASRATNAAHRSHIARRESIWDTPAGRGDFSPWIALLIYGLCSIVIVSICYKLVPTFPVYFLIFFTFLYTPFISYINARIIGICGQYVDIPFIREGAYILSGYKGIDVWLAPIPVENYGMQAQNFRVNELTGTNFWSYVKADCLIVPMSFVLSLVFWAFIWHSSAIPSETFPWAQKMWSLQAKNTVLWYSATMPNAAGGTSLFMQSMHPWVIGGAGVFTLVAFGIMSIFGAPMMAMYGFLQGIGVGMPHVFIPQLIGAVLGKFYFHKRFGQKKFLQMAPVLLAGYGTGVGLIALIGVAVRLITSAISSSPF